MKRTICLALLVIALLALATPARAAREYDQEIREYLKQVEDKARAARKQEREAERNDPHRRLRPYQTLDEINADLDKLIADYPKLLTGGVFGKSVEGRDLRWVRFCVGEGQGTKAQILVTANIHAQELAAGQMALALLHHFAENYGVSQDLTSLADQVEIYFIPIMNPDRMAYAANMQSKYGFTTFIRKNVGKVDLNRNFPYPKDGPDRLKNEAGSPSRWSEVYRGTEPFSEPEARALNDFVSRHNFILAINYHTSGGLILYAPGTYPDPEPDTNLMRDMALAYQAKQFDKYDVQPGIDMYPTLGALDDWLYHRYGILSFTVEVGKDTLTNAVQFHNGTLSPIFWAYNVSELEREKANNVPGALAMIAYALRVHEKPEMRKWKPPAEKWVGENQ